MKNIKEKIGDVVTGERFSSTTLTVMVIAVVLVANTLIYTLFALLGWQISPTAAEDFSLSGNLDDVMKRAEVAGQKVTVMFCYPEKNVSEHGTGGYVYRTAKEFEARYPETVELKFVNIVTNMDEDGNHVDVSKYQKDEYGTETPITKTSVIFVSGDNYKVVTDTSTDAGYANFYVLDYSNTEPSLIAYNGEEVMAASMCWVLKEEHGVAYFTSGHSEVMDPSFIELVSRAGYRVGIVDLKTSEIPEDAELLVISNPRTDFEASAEGSGARSESDRIRHYLENGGNLYVSLNSLADELKTLEGILSDYGISLSYAENEEGYRALNIVRDVPNSIFPSGYTIVAGYGNGELGGKIASNVEKYSDGRVILGDTAALTLSGNAEPILVSSSTAQLYAYGKETDVSGNYVIAASAKVTSKDGKEGHVFVVPSAYLSTTASLITNGYANKDFVYSIMEHLYGCSTLPYGTSIISFRSPTLEGLTMQTANVYTAVCMAIPVAVTVTGAVILIRRKNR